MPYDIIIVGAGISGAVLAERYASIGKRVLVLEKRNHIGGNCYDYVNNSGFMVSKYGAHLFHTSYEDVWQYVQRFSKWRPYEHRVLGKVDGKLVPIPVNITTVNVLLGLNLKNESDMRLWLQANQVHISTPRNGREAALSRVGEQLYEKIFKNYTKKQWDKYPEELDAAVLNRIPVRCSFDDRYFTDKYQYMPVAGYTSLFAAMLDHPKITIRLNTDFYTVSDSLGSYEKLFFSGPVDQFFRHYNASLPELEYRSLRFEMETHDQEYYQAAAVVNYPNEEKFTRIVEYKRIFDQVNPRTTIVKEYSTSSGEPFYPVLNSANRAVHEVYKSLAAKMRNVYFVGRLGRYEYLNMDQAFKQALDLFASQN